MLERRETRSRSANRVNNRIGLYMKDEVRIKGDKLVERLNLRSMSELVWLLIEQEYTAQFPEGR